MIPTKPKKIAAGYAHRNSFEISYFMGCSGFEPETNRLKAEYSTVELATLLTCAVNLRS